MSRMVDRAPASDYPSAGGKRSVVAASSTINRLTVVEQFAKLLLEYRGEDVATREIKHPGGGKSKPHKGGKRLTTEIAVLFPRQGEWTEGSYLDLPDSGRIVELVDGKLVIQDLPTIKHQRAVKALFRAFDDYVTTHRLGEVLFSPSPVRLWEGRVREPDIVFMSHAHDDRKRDEYWGVPDLVVEVLSPRRHGSSGTENTDRVEKLREYAKCGILEYWIVDCDSASIEVYRLRRGGYFLFGKWKAGEVARSEAVKGFEVPVDQIIEM